MNFRNDLLCVAVSLLLSSCGSTTAEFQRTSSHEFVPREANCDFDVYTFPPQARYKELGVIRFTDTSERDADSFLFLASLATGHEKDYDKKTKSKEELEPKIKPLDIQQVKDKAKRTVCRNGGNGLILMPPNAEGKYIGGTVILTESSDKKE